ncbi:MAG: nucleotidyltransferase domain-containing protein [Candidatus Atribacteria bacterium]|nr:nucleotidyltransferase domain-containing protein [Candidatus Atribacteria bacterium]
MGEKSNRALILTENQNIALRSLKNELMKKFILSKMIIFGSTPRGEADEESDLDVLVLLNQTVSHKTKHEIYSIVTHVNLDHNVNIHLLIIDKKQWESKRFSALPLRFEVETDGVVFK